MTGQEASHPCDGRSSLPVRPLEWTADHGDDHRIFRAEAGVGRFAYGTDAKGLAWHQGPLANADHADERTAREAAEADYVALVRIRTAELGLLVDDVVAPPATGTMARDDGTHGFERWLSSSGTSDLCVLHGPIGLARIAWNAALADVPSRRPDEGGRPEAAQAASDLVLAPVDDGPNFSDSRLPYRMIAAGMDVLERVDDDGAGRNGDDVPDWDHGMVAVAVYRAMIARIDPDKTS